MSSLRRRLGGIIPNLRDDLLKAHTREQTRHYKMETTQVSLRNEEDLKNKIILPYIQSLGFTLDEIEFETTFRVRMGKNEHELDGRRQDNLMSGRSDILCHTGQANLFIIEVKADNLEITPADIEQGWSYARLVHPIAPFVLITNGKETKVIDTITKEELKGTNISEQSSFWQKGCKLEIEEEIRQRYEALRKFIGYSAENLTAFSRSQVDARMRGLKGSGEDLEKKYIPELYLDRIDIKESFNEFLSSPSQCFALVGEGGVGKTNYICALTEHVLGNHIAIFYNVASLVGDIFANIKEDFNWVFSASLEPQQILRKLDALLNKERKQKLCIFFDAIDEAASATFALQLDDLLRKVAPFTDFKICISCKSSEWSKLLSQKGSPTWLAETVFRRNEEKNLEGKDATKKRDPSYLVQRFNDGELSELERSYKRYFRFNGTLSGGVRRECRLGFMLRVVAEVYQGRELPSVLDSVELLKSYLEKKFEKMDPEIGRNCLTAIGRALIEKENSAEGGIEMARPDRIEESDLRDRMRLNPLEPLPQSFSPTTC